MDRPLILVVPDCDRSDPGEKYLIQTDYLEAVEEAGGIPLVCSYRRGNVSFLLKHIGGILITGGAFDIHPRFYREKLLPALGNTNTGRTEFELFVVRKGIRISVPILGICGGMQLLNVAFGGSLYQDLSAQFAAARKHRGVRPLRHRVQVVPGSLLASAVRRREIYVNSTHHQAVKRLGRGFQVSASAPDGVVEAIERPSHPFLLGVQWHPERMRTDPGHRRIFASFVKAARVHRNRRVKGV